MLCSSFFRFSLSFCGFVAVRALVLCCLVVLRFLFVGFGFPFVVPCFLSVRGAFFLLSLLVCDLLLGLPRPVLVFRSPFVLRPFPLVSFS